jgi:hypothetical protein
MNKGKGKHLIYILDIFNDEEDFQILKMILSTPRVTSYKSFLIQQVRQYFANILLPIQLQEVYHPEVNKLISNNLKEVTKSFQYPDVST